MITQPLSKWHDSNELVGKMEVLLFDKRGEQLEMLAEILARIGCQIAAAGEESECITKLMGGKYHLLIFDHGIPGLDVTGFVNQIERIDCCMSVAMMATLPSRFYEEKYSCAGIDFLIFEPFGYDAVLWLVKEAYQYTMRLRRASPITGNE